MRDNVLPEVSRLLQAAYHDRLRARLELVARETDNRVKPWPIRRSRRRKPIPGVFDAADDE